jgi:hypothetical protein
MAYKNKDPEKKLLRIHPAFYILGILLVIQIKGDGSFLFPKTLSTEGFMLLALFHWVALVIFIGLSAYWLVTEKTFQHSKRPPLHPFAFGLIPIACIFLISTLHSLQSTYFSSMGYLADNPLIIKISILGSLPLLGYWLRARIVKKHSLFAFLICILLSTLVMKLIPLNLFPVSSTRSDLLPIIKEAGISIYNGENPYKYHMLDSGVNTMNVRFPGLLLAYLPASVTGMDLRLISIASETIIFIILIMWVTQISGKQEDDQQISWELVVPLICFMLFPYWHYRHELYEAPFWLILLLTLFAFDKAHQLWFALGLATLCITHQWGILLAPFLLLGFFKKKGLGPALLCVLPVAFAFLVVYIMILKGNFNDFYTHTFGYYDGLKVTSVNQSFYPLSMFLSLWFVKFNISELLFPIKLASQFPLIYLTFRHGQNTSALAGIMALSLTLVLAFNPVAWTYQYLLVVFLLILGWVFRAKPTTED